MAHQFEWLDEDSEANARDYKPRHANPDQFAPMMSWLVIRPTDYKPRHAKKNTAITAALGKKAGESA